MIATPSSVTAKIQKSAKAKSKTVHIDKLKAYVGKPPKKWTLPNSESDSDAEVRSSSPDEDCASAKVSQTQHSPKFSPLMFSDEQNGLFKVRTPEFDCDSSSSIVSCEVVAEPVNSASSIT